ncbi:CopD family protein [Nocardia sp. CNY236]|uniref:CopD family protein n=1 Tax=Nocardia sp. CNY236 TaxID=1169152 RepID=UPI000408F9A0|nr:CopD family protein [Nocardia sp. CNY236]
MTGTKTGHQRVRTISRSALPVTVSSGLVGVVLAWALILPGPLPVEAIARLGADGVGATVLGLTALSRVAPHLGTPWRLLAVGAGIWLVAEGAVLVFDASEVIGITAADLDAERFGTYLVHVSGGQVGVATLAAVALIAGRSALAYRRPGSTSTDVVLVVAAVAMALRPITGHMSQQPFGSVLAAIHAVAAAGWFGLLCALTLVARTRGDWAGALPRYSAVALPLAATVAVTGLLNGLIRIGGITPLLTSGYGRILLAKTVLLLGLSTLGWWWRRTWVPRAAHHRMNADASLGRAVAEVAVMAVVFGLAATLAVTA